MQLFDYTADEAQTLPLGQLLAPYFHPFVCMHSHTLQTLRNSIEFDHCENPVVRAATLAQIEIIWKIVLLARCEVQARVEFMRGGSPDWLSRKAELASQLSI